VPIAGLTSSLTSLIGNHGIYAVFLLIAIDAVFPAAGELVMVYAGAQLADRLAADLSGVRAFHNPSLRGIGYAYMLGYENTRICS